MPTPLAVHGCLPDWFAREWMRCVVTPVLVCHRRFTVEYDDHNRQQRDPWCLYAVLSGVVMQSAPGFEVVAPAPSLWLVPPMRSLSERGQPDHHGLDLLTIDFVVEHEQGGNPLARLALPAVVPMQTAVEEIAAMLPLLDTTAAGTLAADPALAARPMVDRILQTYLRLGFAGGLLQQQAHPTAPSWLEQFAGELTRRPRDRTDLTALARAAGVSVSGLGHAFRRHYGMSVMAFQRVHRMRAAATMLRSRRERSIAQIATALGYGSPTVFIRHFQRVHGVTPAAWRRIQRPAPTPTTD